MLTTVKPNVQSQKNMCHKNENLDHLPICALHTLWVLATAYYNSL